MREFVGLGNGIRKIIWSSKKGSTEDALELDGEEGRGKLRKAWGRSKHPVIPGLPNGVTRPGEARSHHSEYIAMVSKTQGTEPSQYLQEKKSTLRFPE